MVIGFKQVGASSGNLVPSPYAENHLSQVELLCSVYSNYTPRALPYKGIHCDPAVPYYVFFCTSLCDVIQCFWCFS